MSRRRASDRAPAFGAATLTDCDREPIHLSESIQPHGCLVAVEPTSRRIERAAGDFPRILGVETEAVVGARLEDLVPRAHADRLLVPEVSARPSSVALKTYEVRIPTPAGEVDAIAHTNRNASIVEFEPSLDAPSGGPTDTLIQVQRMLAKLEDKPSVAAYCQSGAELVRAFTGFDRVMIYAFLPDGSGRVIAEDRADHMESYLDLHYPESDIPKQARQLYRHNWLRLIPDVDYRPRAIAPGPAEKGGQPLDLSFSSLRSVSPIHVQYLKNMGVAASMSISIVLGDELWGLIACHHATPHQVSCVNRAACEVFGQVFSLRLESLIHSEDYEYRLRQKGVHGRLVSRLADDRNLAEGLIRQRPNLLDYIQAEGVAILVDGEYADYGRTPGPAAFQAIAAMLNEREEGIIAADSLATLVPEAAVYAADASGMLALSVSRSPRDYVVWFRPEVIETVTWAGDPSKAVQTGAAAGEGLSPRSSFAAWRETVRGRARPWKAVEIEAAESLRLSILEVVLRRLDEVARERARNEERQALLLSELDHRVKNTLANIQALMRFSQSSSDTLEGYVENLERRIGAMAYAHSLLSQNRWEGADLRAIVEEEMAQFESHGRPRGAIRGDEVHLIPRAALSFSLLVHELATNAAKYGALSRPGGRVDIDWRWEGEGDGATLHLRWRESGGPPVEPPSRTGFGRQLIEKSLEYELNATVDLRFEAQGVECYVRLPLENLLSKGSKRLRTSAESTDMKSGLRVLVVEDSMITAMDIAQMVEREGNVILGPTGRVDEATRLVESESPDLALLDINLGNTDTFGLADKLAERGIAFVFLSGYAPESILPKRFAERPCLGKPFSQEQLATAICKATQAA